MLGSMAFRSGLRTDSGAGGGGDSSFCSNPFIKLAMRLLLGANGGLLAMAGLPGRGGFGLVGATGCCGVCFSCSRFFFNSDGFRNIGSGFFASSFTAGGRDDSCGDDRGGSCGDPPPLLALLPARNLFLA